MPPRHSLPRIWLVTDERQGDRLLGALNRLPQGAGILFRHYSLSEPDRRALFDAVRERRADAFLLLAGSPALAHSWSADGWHGPHEGHGLHSESVHDFEELRQAEGRGASFLFVSPVYATRSHPGGKTLGEGGFEALVAQARVPVIALGGITPERGTMLMRMGAHGWAGVDVWL